MTIAIGVLENRDVKLNSKVDLNTSKILGLQIRKLVKDENLEILKARSGYNEV